MDVIAPFCLEMNRRKFYTDDFLFSKNLKMKVRINPTTAKPIAITQAWLYAPVEAKVDRMIVGPKYPARARPINMIP